MIIDIITMVLLIAALLKGYQKGLIIGIVSYLAYIIGLAGAVKLSTITANKIGNIISISDKLLPFVAFLVVLLGIILLVRWMGKLLEFSLKKFMLGWLNRLGGILFFILIYFSIYAILLFYTNQLHFLPEKIKKESVSYELIASFGRQALSIWAKMIPAFSGMFVRLEQFFETAAG